MKEFIHTISHLRVGPNILLTWLFAIVFYCNLFIFQYFDLSFFKWLISVINLNFGLMVWRYFSLFLLFMFVLRLQIFWMEKQQRWEAALLFLFPSGSFKIMFSKEWSVRISKWKNSEDRKGAEYEDHLRG